MKTNKVQTLFEERIHDLYVKLDNELPRIQNNYEVDDLTTFVAQCGRDYPMDNNSGIIFYGRSPNGWNPKSPLTTDGLIEQLHRPFFNLMRVVSEHFYPESWNFHIVWSNVCKVAPAKNGNPTDPLWYDQYNFMVDIIEKEMEILSPKVVIFVTGMTAGPRWDDPLFAIDKYKGFQLSESIEWGADSRTGKPLTSKAGKINNTTIIITDRPECRPIAPHVEAILNLIERLK